MNAWIDGVNVIGGAWFDWILERSVASMVGLAAVLLVLGVLRLLPRGRVSAHLPSHLLVLPLLLLIAPLERLVPASFGGRLPSLPALAAVEPVLGSSSVAGVGEAVSERWALAEPGLAAVDESAAVLSWAALGFVLWAVVAAALGWRAVRRHRHALRLLRRNRERPPIWLGRRFDRLVAECRVGRLVQLRLARGLASPLVCGVGRPVVYLPVDLADSLPADQLDFALRHELEHVRRNDVAIGSVVAWLRMVFWFHPGVSCASALLERWREYACDEAALARGAGRRCAVAETLVILVARASAPSMRVTAGASLLSTKTFMQNRILRILDSRRAPAHRMSLSAFAALGLVSTLTLAVVRSQDLAEVRGDDPAMPVVQAGARWLMANQRADGSWGVGIDPSGKNYRDHNEVCITSMAIRALLPLIDDESVDVSVSIQRALTYVEHSQQENGRFGPNEPLTMMFAHANALRAVCAAQKLWPAADRLARIERGVGYSLFARNPYMGWRYSPRCGDNDSKITSVMLLGLRAAEDVGVTVEPRVFREAMELLDQLTDERTGRTGFVRRGETMSRFVNKLQEFPGKYSEEPTALRLLVRDAAGVEAEASGAWAKSVRILAARPPEWDREKGTIDLAYWEIGAEAMARVGGDAAGRWRERLHRALIENRVVEADRAYWPAIDAWSHPGMEAYTTASAMLALQAMR